MAFGESNAAAQSLQRVQGAGEARQRARRALALEEAERLALELRAFGLELGELLAHRGVQLLGGLFFFTSPWRGKSLPSGYDPRVDPPKL